MFNIEYVKNLKWCNAEHTFFSCTVKYAQFAEELPAGIAPVDLHPHIQEIWQKGVAGEYGVIEEYVEEVPPIPDVAPNQQPTVEGAQTL